MKLFDSEWKVMEVPLAEKTTGRRRNLCAVSGHHRLEQKHDLYGHQKVHRKGRDRAPGAEFHLPRADYKAAGAEGGG